MNSDQRALLEYVSSALFYAEVSSPLTEEVIREAMDQAVLSLLPLKGDVRLLQLVAQNVNVEYMHTRLHEIMSAAGIPYCVIKGVTSAVWYPEPVLRTMGDVDFIVQKEDLERTTQVLKQAGCFYKEYLHDHHRAFSKDGIMFELHWEVPGMPENVPELHRLLSDLIESAELKNGCMQATAFHHGLILLLHTAEHLLNTGIGLRHLCDWAVFEASFTDSEFREMFETPLKSAGMWRFAQLLSLTSAKWLSAPKLPWMGEAEDNLLDGIMDDILDAGNFGKKNPERINQAKFITDRSSRSVGTVGPVRQFAKTMTEKAYFEWPLCKKVKALLPAGWAYISVRHLIKIHRGKRPKMHVTDMVKGSQKRRKIYREFNLFQ